ncbi:NitT/TauT family transport system substrate-binding protein [Anaerosphaera aminiphila DSM 21120]|uniref:NitT/TauT family transport system substrate-binding protein n=1 Tax=Anaerosphaera aminiphila DSM 21120 TaxID=1120995 RepID=A0A1M5QA91_9FIRM|nr:MqnA/MqnD/SBP family protein [Anaerosphaera aminiphila]SHH10649.1 NitT/TauT family transport system substrate-binding protein [Anaerosphaera aminiphila DSM 21120]
MKNKILSTLLVFVFLFSLVGCGNKNENIVTDEAIKDNVTIKVGALKGPTAMGLVKVFDDSDKGVKQSNTYDYKIVASPDEIVAGLSKGDFDVAAIPANLASILYNKTEGKLLKVSNINTLGVLYLASRDDISDVESLKGRTIVTSGKGSTPEFALRQILSKSNIDPDNDVTIEYKAQHEEVLAELINNESAVVMLPQPFLTVAKQKVEGLKVNFSLNDLWKEINGEPLITGVLVVRNEFLEENKENFNAFLSEYKNSVDFVNNNVDEAAALVGNYDIVPEAVAKIAIPDCNIVYIDGQESEDALSNYLNILFEADQSSVGGVLPDENFYYKK